MCRAFLAIRWSATACAQAAGRPYCSRTKGTKPWCSTAGFGTPSPYSLHLCCSASCRLVVRGRAGCAAVTITSIQVVLASVSIRCTSAVCMGLACLGASSAGRACSMVAVTPLLRAYWARWSRSSSCLCRLVCRAHAAACKPSTSSCPWQMGPCPNRRGRLQRCPAPGVSKPNRWPMLNLKASLLMVFVVLPGMARSHAPWPV